LHPSLPTRTALYASVLFLTCSDFYWLGAGLPVVSIVAAALYLVASAMYRSTSSHRWLEASAGVVFCLACVAASVLVRAAEESEHAPKAVAGFALGLLVAWITATRAREHTRDLAGALRFTLAVHVGFCLVQAAIYQFGGPYLDMTGWLSDNVARYETYLYTWGYSGLATRWTGLMAEPASYSTVVFLLVGTRVAERDAGFTWLDGIACLTMLACLSFTGLAYASLLAVVVIAQGATKQRWLTAGALGSVVVAALSMLSQGTYLTERMSVMHRDGSLRARLWDQLDFLARQDEWHLLLGRGIGAYSWQIGRGSGVTDLLIYIGLLGTLVFLGFAGWCFWRHRSGVAPVVLWLASFFAAPHQTNPFWWVWTAALMVLSARDQPA
jgi:hypothetical protein